MNRQEHLTLDGLVKVVSLRGGMNTGLSEKLKAAFPAAVPVERPLVTDQEIKDPHWLAGFSSGEGSFFLQISTSPNRVGFRVKLRYSITQHSLDAKLITSFQEYLGCGGVYIHSENAVVFVVTRFSDIHEKIIPFFSKYQIQGVKALDFVGFCKAAEILKSKARARGPCKTQRVSLTWHPAD